MNFETVFIILFVLILASLVISHRKKMSVQKVLFPLLYLFVWRTKLGLKSMESFAEKHKKSLKWLGYLSIFVGFAGMALISFELIRMTIGIILNPSTAAAGVGLVLPIKAKGVFYVPFTYWILSLIVLMTVHEFSHGVFAKWTKTKIKSSGVLIAALLVPILPGAFVEPDERQLSKKRTRDQLMVFSAGAFANVIVALIALLAILFIFTPISSNMIEADGVVVTGFTGTEYPASVAGIIEGEVILSADGIDTTYHSNFSEILKEKSPGDSIFLLTDKSKYNITLMEDPENSSKAILGVYAGQHTKVKESFAEKYGAWTPSIIIWLFGLFVWIHILNLGIGLFNLAPIGPLDGGKMLLLALEKFFKKEKAKKIWAAISFIFLALVIINIAFIFLR